MELKWMLQWVKWMLEMELGGLKWSLKNGVGVGRSGTVWGVERRLRCFGGVGDIGVGYDMV